eukprot:634540-Pleurochrysis_carterae.AAC.1
MIWEPTSTDVDAGGGDGAVGSERCAAAVAATEVTKTATHAARRPAAAARQRTRGLSRRGIGGAE